MFQRLFLCTAIVALLAAPVAADSISVVQTDPGATLPGYVANDILITVPGQWTGIRGIQLTPPPPTCSMRAYGRLPAYGPGTGGSFSRR